MVLALSTSPCSCSESLILFLGSIVREVAHQRQQAIDGRADREDCQDNCAANRRRLCSQDGVDAQDGRSEGVARECQIARDASPSAIVAGAYAWGGVTFTMPRTVLPWS